MSRPRVTYAPALNSKPEGELSALVSVYRFALDCAKKGGSRPGTPDDARKDKNAGIQSNCI